jgi:quercetin 2,3-dioxygenase
LVLSGAPILQPIVGYGPFVMNTRQEIETAMQDFRLGKFGQLTVPNRGAEAASSAS